MLVLPLFLALNKNQLNCNERQKAFVGDAPTGGTVRCNKNFSWVWPVERDLTLPSISCGFESMRKKGTSAMYTAQHTAKIVSWLIVP